MDQGAIIAAGAPEDVMRDARVVDAYLGRAVA
jgi:ABC-type branched-subunit amino acid transport system ATPase component